jgi:hypothetical protein
VRAEPAGKPQFGRAVRQALVAAVEAHDCLGYDYLGTEPLLLALARLNSFEGTILGNVERSALGRAQILA